MRVTGGLLRGRVFSPPVGKWPTRPTTDMSREALFNILQNRLNFETCAVLDLFGGTGAHSIEFASRGSKQVHYVDKHKACCRFVEAQMKIFQLDGIITIFNFDYQKFINNCIFKYDYIFADPPYALPRLHELPDLIARAGILKSGGWFVLEHNKNWDFSHRSDFVECRKYGHTIFTFFKP